MDAPSVEELAPTTSPWPTHWYTVVGSAFTPSNSTIAYTYGSNGCIKPSTAGQWRASVNLPDGSVIKYIYINYYNGDAASTATSTAWLTRYIFTGVTSDLVNVTSHAGTTTGTGYYFDLSPELTSIVDNLSSGYMFVWSGSTGQNLCSIKVGYYAPTFGAIALPFIQK
jgi:hypothetical protein